MITLDRRKPDGFNDNGRGLQCTKYSWYLGTGIMMNYAPHPDYGPVNGVDMVDYLVKQRGFVRCGKENGAIFAYPAGKNGHTGMVVDALKNLVNDANWGKNLKVTTHTINLDATAGIEYCKPAGSTPTPTPTAPTTLRKATTAELTAIWQGKYGNMPARATNLRNAGIDPNDAQARINKGEGKPQAAAPANDGAVYYKYKTGDTFGQVIVNLGLATKNGLWGTNGDVAYYNQQLRAQGITGNIPVGRTIKLVKRKV